MTRNELEKVRLLANDDNLDKWASLRNRVQVMHVLKYVDYLESEIVRLKRGDFTEKEFQDLCHHFSEDDRERFKAGCKEYQRQLFGSIGFEERSEE